MNESLDFLAVQLIEKHLLERRVAKLAADIRSRAAALARLAIVYADPLRMKIVTELYLREMSPKMFFEEFGGGSLPRVDRHFKVLAKHGWIRFIRQESGGRRRGAIEHFYRASELVIVDEEMWSELPLSLRASFSVMTFDQLTERVGAAITAGTFNARPDRRLDWTSISLDQVGWKRVLGALGALFETVLEEQDRARLRIAKFGETPVLATVGMAAFESPRRDRGKRGRPARPKAPSHGIGSARTAAEAMLLFPAHVAKLFADPLALQILAETNDREISPKQFHGEFGGATLSNLSRRFKKLEKAGWLRLARKETGGKRRGAIEHFYQAVGPAILEHCAWSEVPEPLKATLAWKTFEQLREAAIAAIETGTFDTRPERHLTWSLLLLDQRGWEQIVAALDTFFATLSEAENSAELRLAESGEQPILATLALTAFESPKDSAKAP